MNYRDFRSRFRLIPFGKFSLSGRGESPFNQIFVGRTRERAKFIELLTHQSQFGSFLVSGRRGSGKTSFVRYTLDEYRQSAFHRFIRVGRNQNFADLQVGFILTLVISFVTVLLGQFIELLSQNAVITLFSDEIKSQIGGSSQNFGESFRWTLPALILLTIAVLSIFPYAYSTSKASVSGLRLTSQTHRLLSIIVPFASILIALGISIGIDFLNLLAACYKMVSEYADLSLQYILGAASGWISGVCEWFTSPDKCQISAADIGGFFSLFYQYVPVEVWAAVSIVVGFTVLFCFAIEVPKQGLSSLTTPNKKTLNRGFRWALVIALLHGLITTFLKTLSNITFVRTINSVHRRTSFEFLLYNLVVIGFGAYLYKQGVQVFSNTDSFQGIQKVSDILFLFSFVLISVFNANTICRNMPVPLYSAIAARNSVYGHRSKISNSSSHLFNSKIYFLSVSAYLAFLKLVFSIGFFLVYAQSYKKFGDYQTSVYYEKLERDESFTFYAVLFFILAIFLISIALDVVCSNLKKKTYQDLLSERSKSPTTYLAVFILAVLFVPGWYFISDLKSLSATETQSVFQVFGPLVIPLLVTGTPLILKTISKLLKMALKRLGMPVKFLPFVVEDYKPDQKRPYNYIDRPPVGITLFTRSAFIYTIAAFSLIPVYLLAIKLFDNPIIPGKDWGYLSIDSGVFGAVFSFIIIAFMFEYDWIGRALRAERQDGSITPLGKSVDHPQFHELWPNAMNRAVGESNPEEKKTWKDPFMWQGEADGDPMSINPRKASKPLFRRREIARQIEQVSLPYLYYNNRLPTIFSWINLGFDNLQHSRIIEAMLVQLREKYIATFISPRSIIGLSTIVLAGILSLMITQLLATNFFHVGFIPQSDNVKIYEKKNDDGAPINGATDYCAFFEQNKAYAPAASTLICLLPYSNDLFRFAYTPILQLSVDFRSIVPISNSNRIEATHPRHIFQLSAADQLDTADSENTKITLCSEKAENCGNKGGTSSILLTYIIDRNLGLPYLLKGQEDRYEDGQFTAYHPELKNDVKGRSQEQESQDEDVPALAEKEEKLKEETSGLPAFRVYHLLLLFLSFFLVGQLNRYAGLIPYRYRIREMNKLLDRIRGKVTKTKQDYSEYSWLQRLLGMTQRAESYETSPDPRIVEQLFINLLSTISQQEAGRQRQLFGRFEAKPEIVFVFDEMDKLTGKADAEITQADEAMSTAEDNLRERNRSQQLHQLLSDMKRLLSSNSARFIFIGGRLYHDEWLADLATRSPLLTSIFNGHIYLPSLLTDREHPFGYLNDRIAEFLSLLFRNSIHRFELWRNFRNSPAFVENVTLMDPTYVQEAMPYSGHPRRLAAFATHLQMRVIDENGQHYCFKYDADKKRFSDKNNNGENDKLSKGKKFLKKQRVKQDLRELHIGEQETLSQLLNFLTYRSQGNPKKLKEMLQEMIQPASKGFNLPRTKRHAQHQARWVKTGQQHDVLVLDDKTLYRMQFIDVLYRHLMEHVESKMLERDDKVAMSVFYLMDFLLKFHNRGFSWTNLQRVDELSHIHRAPDLRSMMGVLVDVSSERFLHRVMNGVYSFRFRSDIAREIDYLSRNSKDEMAALNFTLDESQNLKGLYQQTINTGERENTDTIAGLGELYEYDQEFEIARNYYRRAIARLDKDFMTSTGARFKSGGEDITNEQGTFSEENSIYKSAKSTGPDIDWLPMGFVQQAIKNGEAKSIINANFSWAVSRLRLMLQIGHTYEQERNYERALGSYMHGHNFSQAILEVYSDKYDTPSSKNNLDKKDTDNKENNSDEYEAARSKNISGKNYSILYQSGIAAAWIYEKDNQDIDESIRQVEKSVLQVYLQNKILFAKRWEELLNDKHHYSDDSLSVILVASDLHDKAGDVFFYKGKQATRGIKDFDEYRIKQQKSINGDVNQDSSRFGYLLQAHHHYAMSIWNIRNFLAIRRRLSGHRLNILENAGKLDNSPTVIADGPLPDMLHNILSNSLTDMSEAILARSAMGDILWSLLDLHPTDTDEVDMSQPDENIKNFDKVLRESVRTFIHKLQMTEFSVEGVEEFDQIIYQPILNKNGTFRKSRGKVKTERRCINLECCGAALGGGALQTWLGKLNYGKDKELAEGWPSDINKFHGIRTLVFPELKGSLDRLSAYMFFSTVAAKSLSSGGYSIDSANEYLLQAETMIDLLWTIRRVQWMAIHSPNEVSVTFKKLLLDIERLKDVPESLGDNLSNAVDKIIEELKKSEKDNKERTRSFDTAQCVLGTMAINSLNRAAKLIRISYRPSSSRNHQNHGDRNKITQTGFRKLRDMLKKHSALLEELLSQKRTPRVTGIARRITNFGDTKLSRFLGRFFEFSSELNGIRNDVFVSWKNESTRNNLILYLRTVTPSLQQIHSSTTRDTEELENRLKEFQLELIDLLNRYPMLLDEQDFHEKHMDTDYDLSQAWRDDPRLLTLGASLVLSLISHEDEGQNRETNELFDSPRHSNKLAKYVYESFLKRYGSGLYADLKIALKSYDEIPQIIRLTYSGLYKQCERYRYPVLNRLKSIKILIEAAVIHGPTVIRYNKDYPDELKNKYESRFAWSDKEIQIGLVNRNTPDSELEILNNIKKARLKIRADHAAVIGRLCDELIATAGIYDSEMHFSPHDLGTSLMLAYFFCIKHDFWALYDNETSDTEMDLSSEHMQRYRSDTADWRTATKWKNHPRTSSVAITREALGETALNQLRRSEQMFSHGKAYYENISHLQYLNDDFNDRSLHFNHARRMMFSETTHLYASAIHKTLFEKD